MATVKINFPSPFGVYMHDTPIKKLFTVGDRYFSSGCVRIDKVHILVNWILCGQDGWDFDHIEEVAATGERLDVDVKDGPQLRFAYLTAWVTDDGRVNFRPDIYELDGTGFVTGQPLPVGEGYGSQRWITKPLPDQEAALAAEGLEPAELKEPPPASKVKKRKTNFSASPSLDQSDATPGVPTFGQEPASN